MLNRFAVDFLAISFLFGGASCGGAQATGGPEAGHHSRHAGDSVDRRQMDHKFEKPEKFAERWNDASRDAWQKPEEIVAAAEIEAGDAVADLGSGTGYLLGPLRDAVGDDGQVFAIDVEPAMVEYLRGEIEAKAWSNVVAHQSSHDDPKLGPASLDAIVTLNTWHHIEGREPYAKLLTSALKPDGRLVIVDFIAEPTEGDGPPLQMRLKASDVVDELVRSGLSARIVDESMPRHYVVVATLAGRLQSDR
ncbi:MAG: methyltransferase domain-containing protein [Myxococcota bacterium]